MAFMKVPLNVKPAPPAVLCVTVSLIVLNVRTIIFLKEVDAS